MRSLLSAFHNQIAFAEIPDYDMEFDVRAVILPL